MLLLLDIDGVLVQAASWKKVELLEDGFYKFMPNAVNSLKEIISETGATIVLTSSHKSSFPLAKWKELFKSRGINAKLDKLGDNTSLTSRKDEILSWMSQNNNPEDFVIIDDDKSLNDLPQFIKDRVVFTQPLIGLSKSDASHVIELFKKPILA